MRDTRDPGIQDVVSFVADRIKLEPEVALVLGSGLGSFAEDVQDKVVIPTGEIPGYPVSTVEGHAGRIVAGTVDGVKVLVFQGRVHYYEGYPMAQVVFPVRLAAALGSKALIVTNAAGGLGDGFEAGDLMLITDHINLMGTNPLIGQTWGFERFPDMTRAYHPDLQAAIRAAAQGENIELRHGILGGWSGPTYETLSEVRMLKLLGVSAACMSTIPEIIAAARVKLPACGVSCITNLAAGLTDQPLTHDEVTEVAAKVEKKFHALIRAAVPEVARAAQGIRL